MRSLTDIPRRGGGPSGSARAPVRTVTVVLEEPGKDGMRREEQLILDFLCASAGGPLYYTGRDMKLAHEGMGIDESDWRIFVGCLEARSDKFQVPSTERG